ncbi:response regulator transcription factor [Kineosporia rhizophila]|uniref:response regulator n=1 Tax=Kineosporia rhizophila TaxID=84633 RepID=UPI001E575FAC|nr:response regulator transcription factor [Kineosporia rhizophila]
MTITVLVADDQDMVRTGFAMILGAQPDIEVVAECADGVATVEAARRLRPDVVMLDIRMPGLDGLEVTRLLAGPGAVQPLRVLVVTTFGEDALVDTALDNGALGFLLKDAGPALLVEAVRAAAAGDALISPSLTRNLLHRRQAAPARPTRPGTAALLSERELQIVRLVARGRTNGEISEELFLALGTVKSHLAKVQTKLGLTNRVQVAAWAWENGQMQR